MKTLADAKVGDLVVISYVKRVRFTNVQRATPKLIFTSSGESFLRDSGKNRDGHYSGTLRFPTSEEMHERDDEMRERQRVADEREAYSKREDVQIASSILCAEMETLLRIPIEQLRQIAAMLDAAKEAK